MSKLKIETGSSPAPESFNITVMENGPYLVFGQPPLATQFIMPNNNGESWYFQEGKSFSMEAEPTALCRCGASRRKPYCDGEHLKADWDPRLTADQDAMLDDVEVFEGETIEMTDNRKYCVLARFCHPGGDAWTLTENEKEYDSTTRALAIREASMCPSGRLMTWDKKTRTPHEFHFEPSLGLIQDPAAGASAGLWVKGGIITKRENGDTYEVRNRVVLCRCGQSQNKPYCDGMHMQVKWKDGLDDQPTGATVPEKVY
ncbi:CDGSH iron-sulfur domain-containing protein [uncultured Alistipes sp.]|jgi:conserved hypothetical protein|uniref:CDGSH iron-sulfur domain-containing protein n=1 Tax=uncultured Alistipes sp. TaxID=538949 RepID=UPI0025CF2838|nr:CDGSH iron-sulfur domain-containing protein [uncultured Alistipes sp.]